MSPLYLGLLALVILERLFELMLSQRNRRRVLVRGGFEIGAEHYPVMVAVHTLFLISCVVEPAVLDRPLQPWVAAPAAIGVALAMALRYWAIHALGDRWSTRVLTEPGVPPVSSGPYRWLRHPNYLAVVIEIAALPMVHSAVVTAAGFTVVNAWLLRRRIGTEELALRNAARAPAINPLPAGAP